MNPRQRQILRKASATHQRRRPPPTSATNFGNSYENFILRKQNVANKLKAQKADEFVKKLLENHAATKIQARVRGIRNRKKVKKIRLLREKEKLLKAEKKLLNQLANLSPNSPRKNINSPNASPRTSPNASPSNNKELAELYARSRRQPAKAKMARRARIEKRRGKIARKRKRKSSPKKQPSKRRRVDFNLPKPNAATAKMARQRVIEKRRRRGEIKKKMRKKPMIFSDLITGKEKIFTKEGWFLRAKAKQNALRARICA